jgi:hypothetical protein
MGLGPYVIAVSPTWGETRVSLTSHIQIRLQDAVEVVLTTIKVYINSGAGFVLAYEGGGSPDFKPGWDGPASALTGPITNRLLVIDSTAAFPSNTVIGVWVFAEDPGGNPAQPAGLSTFGSATFGTNTFGG